jgi:apolipoprotein D and lipocalin family protein
MKKKNAIIAVAAGAGLAGAIFALWPKKKIPRSSIVEPFDKNKYLGIWHEIARLPNRIEKHLKDVTDEYSLNDDGTLKVTTRAYHQEKNKPVEAEGTIKFAGPETRGALKVAYFLPIYLDYNVLDIDKDYKYALVSGSSLEYLSLLSRDHEIPDSCIKRFLKKATALGFDTGKLEWNSNEEIQQVASQAASGKI